jgi:hypothetical protein
MGAMKLISQGVPAKLLTFGGFRVGDFDFADFAETKLTDAFRVAYE